MEITIHIRIRKRYAMRLAMAVLAFAVLCLI